MRHIVLFIPNLDGAGAERVCMRIYNMLKETPDVSVKLILQEKRGALLESIEMDNVSILGTRNTLKSAFLLRKYLKISNADVVMGVMNTPSVVVGLASVGIKKITKIGSVHNLIDYEMNLARKSFKGYIRTLLYPIGFSLLDTIIFVSDVCKDTFRKNVKTIGSVELVRIYNPVLECIPEQSCEEIRASQTFRILYVGRLVEIKNLFALIESVVLLKNDGADVSLTIVGEGVLETPLAEFALERGASSYIIFKGYMDRPFDDAGNYNLFCLPSLSEGFGNVLIEAMAAGLPVMTTKNGGGEEAVADCGYIVSGFSAEELYKGFSFLIDSPSVLKQFRLKSISHIHDFTVAKSMDMYREILVKI